tara:strand:- start:1297 stop:2142 length:846 start_codon:yes stop_codon:yes gene_type:complete
MKAVVEIKGGFGNQIFQYSFANYLNSKGYEVTVNINKIIYKSGTQRFPLNNNNFGFKQTNQFIVLLFKLLYLISQKNIFNNSLNKLINKIFRKEYNFENFLNSKKRYFNHFDGYWQNIELLTNQKDYIIRSLNKEDAFKNNLKRDIQEGTTLVHVRRGDYIDIGENLNVRFYEEAINLCKSKIDKFSFEVFTDDLKWVTEQNIFKNAKAIHGPKDNIEELLSDITKMFNFQNFIIGNSSFPLIPAIFSNSKNNLIIIADPWMKNQNIDLNFDKTWIKIKNY